MQVNGGFALDDAAAPASENPLPSDAADREQQQRWSDRYALGRVESVGVELDDISEVEYREVRLEKVVLVGIFSQDRDAAESSLRELAALASTAGAKVLAGLTQRREQPDAATFLGKGKARELRQIVAELGADTVIVDEELAPSQRRGLEDQVGVKVIDRTALILDIFAQHATSREGKAQVELAQLEYLLPRLRGWGESMSRQAGGRAAAGEGIGARGPGETKIELDRRRIRTRMARLRRLLKQMAPSREAKRNSRQLSAAAAVAIVGYTNAGKSSLLNQLTGANALVHNALFATLDPLVRQARTPQGRVYTISDTVGFVRRLPTQLIEAFSSTLEEAALSDLIVHVVDASDPNPLAQIEAVNDTLGSLESIKDIPVLMVVNKIDCAAKPTLAMLRHTFPAAVWVSARTGQGIDLLHQAIAARLPLPQQRVRGVIYWQNLGLLERVYREGNLQQRRDQTDGVYIDAQVHPALAALILDQATGEKVQHE